MKPKDIQSGLFNGMLGIRFPRHGDLHYSRYINAEQTSPLLMLLFET